MKIEKGGKIVPDSMGAAVAWASRAERKGGTSSTQSYL